MIARPWPSVTAPTIQASLPALRTARMKSTYQDWTKLAQQALDHPLRDVLHQDPFTYRAFAKPRGYAGDAVLLDFIYGREEGWPVPENTSEIGKKVFEFTTRSTACEGVRARRGFVADVLDELVDETPRPHVLSIACGHLREAHLSSAVKRRKIGKLVAFGLGGVLAELLEDMTYGFAPFDAETAREMIFEIRGARLLDGYRGRPRLDVAALADTLARVSLLIADHADRIAEIDVNPLFVREQGVVAADALVVLKE